MGLSDFNDMAAHAGLDAVREYLEGAIGRALAGDTPDAKGKAAAAPGAALLDRFAVNADGVWFADYDQEGRAKSAVWVCTRLEVPRTDARRGRAGVGLLAGICRPVRAAETMGDAGANAGG